MPISAQIFLDNTSRTPPNLACLPRTHVIFRDKIHCHIKGAEGRLSAVDPFSSIKFIICNLTYRGGTPFQGSGELYLLIPNSRHFKGAKHYHSAVYSLSSIEENFFIPFSFVYPNSSYTKTKSIKRRRITKLDETHFIEQGKIIRKQGIEA